MATQHDNHRPSSQMPLWLQVVLGLAIALGVIAACVAIRVKEG